MLKAYIKNVLIGIDQLVNAMTGGDPDETISSRMGKQKGDCKFCFYACKLLSLIDKRHCIKSIEIDEGKDAL